MPVKQVKILGSCAICGELEADHLERMVRAEAARLGVEITLETITDFAAIAAHGVLDRPGLVIDGKVVSAGRLPKPEHLEFWLSEEGDQPR